MAAKHHRRSEWHQQNGMWTRSLGDRGVRVRLFQRTKGGVFYHEVWRAGLGKDRRSLNTTNRGEAERLGRALLAALLCQEEAPVEGPVSLQYLFDRYQRESPDFLDNKLPSQLQAAGRMKILVGYFGGNRDVQTFNGTDIASYTRRRLVGGIVYAAGSVTGPVRMRSVHADLSLLCTVLRWATTVPIGPRRRLLGLHPLVGVRLPREKNPRRTVATFERFEATRQGAQALAVDAVETGTRLMWVRVEMALVLMEATGRRRGSIRQLMWEDIDFARGEIRWRAEADKKGNDWRIPVPDTLLTELRTFQRQLGAIGGWLFPATHDPSQPIEGGTLSALLRQAEERAGLPKLVGGLCHPYRRKWATERKHLSLKDVAAAGGWKDVQTLLTCYQHADRDTMLKVMSEPTKVTAATTMGS